MAKKMKSGGSSSLAVYGDFSLDEVEDLEKSAQASRGGSLLKLKPGKTVVRVVPPKKGERLIKVAYVHYVDVPAVGRVSFNCPRIMAKRACKVCKSEADLMATGDEYDYKRAKKLSAKRQCYLNVIVRGEEELGPRTLRFGKMIEDQLLEIRRDEDDGGGNFAHPVTGFDLRISRKGDALDTEYKVVAVGDGAASPLAEDAEQSNIWITGQPDIGRWLLVLSDDQIESKLRGEDDSQSRRGSGRGSRDYDDEPPRRVRSSKTIDDEIDGVVIDADWE